MSAQCYVSYRNQSTIQRETNTLFSYETHHWPEMGSFSRVTYRLDSLQIYSGLYRIEFNVSIVRFFHKTTFKSLFNKQNWVWGKRQLRNIHLSITSVLSQHNIGEVAIFRNLEEARISQLWLASLTLIIGLCSEKKKMFWKNLEIPNMLIDTWD